VLDASDVIAIVSAVISSASVAAAALVYSRQRRSAHFELARALHSDLTSGEVAAARSILRVLVLGTPDAAARVNLDDARDAYFRLLWCFERIYAGRLVLVGGSARRTPPRKGSPAHFLDDAIGWHVVYWDQNLDTAKEIIATRFGVTPADIPDGASRGPFDQLRTDLREIGRLTD
jgi:hypothetical protein